MKTLLLFGLLLITQVIFAGNRVCPDPSQITIVGPNKVTVSVPGWRVDLSVGLLDTGDKVRFFLARSGSYVQGDWITCSYWTLSNSSDINLRSTSLFNDPNYSSAWKHVSGRAWNFDCDGAERTACSW